MTPSISHERSLLFWLLFAAMVPFAPRSAHAQEEAPPVPALEVKPSTSDSAPVSSPAAPPVEERPLLRFETSDPDKSFEVELKTGGGTYRCEGAVSKGAPCELRGVPSGTAQVTLKPKGGLKLKKALKVPEGSASVEIRKNPSHA